MNQHIEKERYDMNDFRKRSGQPKKSGAAAKRGQGKNGRTASANGFSSPRKSSGAASTKPYYQTKLQGRTGAQPGDYVIISFGHNDVASDANRKTTLEEFAQFHERFVDDVLARGGHPVLCSPTQNRRFDDRGRFAADAYVGQRAAAMKAAAEAKG